MTKTGRPQAPPEWSLAQSYGFGPFVTFVEYELEDGTTRAWHSRRHRKADLVSEERGRGHASPRTWWIASLFAIGATCFAVGSTGAWTGLVSASTDASTFFVGSIFFTVAAYLSFAEVAGTPTTLGRGNRRSVRLFSFQPQRIDWWATSVQLVGTLLFNLSTFNAMVSDLDARQIDQLVWWPDLGGSVCFLLASYLAWAEVCHSAGRLRFGDVSWWIVIVNLAGSILFGLSAVGARIILATGEERNANLVSFGTFWGAIGFLVGAVLLIPEARRGLGGNSAVVA